MDAVKLKVMQCTRQYEFVRNTFYIAYAIIYTAFIKNSNYSAFDLRIRHTRSWQPKLMNLGNYNNVIRNYNNFIMTL